MPTPAKDRFMHHVQETVNCIEVNCLDLSKDVSKFGNVYLAHTTSIILGMVQRVRSYLIVNNDTLKKVLPKGVKKHGN